MRIKEKRRQPHNGNPFCVENRSIGRVYSINMYTGKIMACQRKSGGNVKNRSQPDGEVWNAKGGRKTNSEMSQALEQK